MIWRTLVLLLVVMATPAVLPAAEPTAQEAARIADACPQAAPAKPKAARRVLVFSRNEGFDHTAIGVGALAIETLGKRTGAFTATHSTDLAVLSAAGLKPFDAVVFNNGYGFKLTDPKARAALLDFARGGRGVIGIHAASANFEGWAEGTELMGALFHSHPWVPSAEWAVRNEQPEHPLNAAFDGQGFRIRDEIYTFTEFRRDRVRVLLSLDLGDAATGAVAHPHPYVPVSWIYPLGRGRVFFSSLGHQHEVFWNTAHLRHLLAGIQYALGDLPAPDQPDPAAVVRVALSPNQAESRASVEALDLLTDTTARRAATERAILARLIAEPGAVDLLAEPLSKVASNASLGLLAPWLTDSARGHRARGVLQRLGTPEAIAALRGALADATGAQRAGLISSLAALADRQAVPGIVACLRDADVAVVSAALLALGTIGGDQAAEALLGAEPPVALAPVRDDALARCAAGLAMAKRTAQAEALYTALTDGAKPPRTRALGLSGLVEIRSPRAARLAAEFLESGDGVLAAGAARLVARIPGEVIVARAAAAYAKLTTELQAPLLTALGQRRAPVALTLAIGALASETPALRQAGVQALGSSGQVAAIAPLAAFAAQADRDERRWALDALAALRGDGVDAALAAGCERGDAAARAMLVSVIAARRQPGAAAQLLKAAADAEPLVATEALRGLGRLGEAAHVGALVKLLAAARGDDVLAATMDALAAILRRQTNKDAALKPLLEALPTARSEVRAALLSVLAETGGKAAVAELVRALDDPDGAVSAAALTALAEVAEDPAAASALLALALASDGARRVTATRGWLRVLAAMADDDAAGVVRALAGAETLLARPEERRQALSVLRLCRVPAAITQAAKWLDDEEVRAEAMATVRHLASAQRADGRQLAAVVGPEATAALDRVGALKDAHLPKPWRCDDVGEPTPAGSAVFADGRWTLKAAGSDFFGGRDGGMMVWQRCRGDVTVSARVASLAKTHEWAKAGVMVRGSLDGGSPYVACLVSGNPQGVIQTRVGANAETAYEYIKAVPPSWVRVARRGNRFVCSVSVDGQTWQVVGERTLDLPAEAYVGFALTSHADGTHTTAGVESLEIAVP